MAPGDIPQLLSRFGRSLLVQAPTDRLLAAAFARLAERGFTLPPPPPDALPREEPGRVFARWTAEDRASVAAALVTLPDPIQDPVAAFAAFELLVRVPAELGRARLLLDTLNAAAGRAREGRGGPDAHTLALAGLRLALAEAAATGVRPDLGQLLAAFRRQGHAPTTAAALRLAASYELQQPSRQPPPRGLDWLVPVADGAAVPGLALALARRPALGDESPRVIDWLAEAGPPPWLAAAEDADRRGDFTMGSQLLQAALEAHATPSERDAAMAARARLLGVDAGRASALDALFPLPPTPPADAPRSGWSAILARIFDRSPIAIANRDEAAIASLLGERRLVAEYLLGCKDPAVIADVHILGRESVRDTLALPIPRDEVVIARDPTTALRVHRLLDPGPERALLGLRLVGAGIAPLSVANEIGPATAPEAAENDEPMPAPDDPHHPEQRLAAARILADNGQLDAAAAIASALLRRLDRHAPRGLLPLVAELLEHDEPPRELVTAVARALDDDRRSAPLLALLVARPLAAYGLHAELYDYAIDPSRPDARRADAIAAWLHLWIASETAPDSLGIRRMRETDAPLLAVAVARLAQAASVLGAASDWLRTTSHLPDAEVAAHALAFAARRPSAEASV
jgi:hypothetical protein